MNVTNTMKNFVDLILYTEFMASLLKNNEMEYFSFCINSKLKNFWNSLSIKIPKLFVFIILGAAALRFGRNIIRVAVADV
jgi:hypothetical protein